MRLIESLSPTQVLVFCGVTLLMALVLGWRLYLGLFRREPPGIFRRSFLDATGQPNGVLLTVFNAVVMVNALTINGMLTSHWPPVYVWATWGTIVLIGIGADTKVTLDQIKTGRPPAPLDGAGPGLSTDCPPPPEEETATPTEPTPPG